jgi:hypothetical protein
MQPIAVSLSFASTVSLACYAAWLFVVQVGGKERLDFCRNLGVHLIQPQDLARLGLGLDLHGALTV